VRAQKPASRLDPCPPVVVYPPTEGGGRRVRVDGTTLGTAYSLYDMTVFLQHAGLEGWDELDVAGWQQIEWRAGGPGVWKPKRQAPARWMWTRLSPPPELGSSRSASRVSKIRGQGPTWPDPAVTTHTATTNHGKAVTQAWNRVHPRLTRRAAWLDQRRTAPDRGDVDPAGGRAPVEGP
jgi:hypothetical protein